MTSILITTGHLIDPFKLEGRILSAKMFIKPLCLLNRYTGHTVRPVSVAEHTYKLSKAKPVVERRLQRAALLHDFNEALTNDLPRPFKQALPDYVAFEERVQRYIFRWFDEPWEHMDALKEYDYRICQDEMQQLFDEPFDLGVEPLDIHYPATEQHWTVWEQLLTDRCHEFGIQ